MKTFRGGNSFILALASFNVGSTWYLASGSYKDIEIWNVNDGSLLRRLKGHDDWVTCLAVLNERLNGMPILSSGSNDAAVKLWSTNNRNLMNTLSGHINYVLSLAVSSNQYINASFNGSANSTIKTWNTD